MNTIHCFSMSTEYCRLVLCKASACIDDRHLKLMAEFDLGEPNFEVLRKVSACDDDRHFSNTLQFPHAGKGHSPTIRASLTGDQGSSNALSVPRAVIKAKW